MKIVLCIPVWKREKIFEKVMQRMNEVRKWSDSEILIYCAGDKEDPCRQVFEDLAHENDRYIIAQNRPVSNKINKIFKELSGIDFDYACTGASDDVVSDNAWNRIESLLNEWKYHFIGIKDINFYDTISGKAAYYMYNGRTQNRTVGCYRFLHYNLLKSLNFTPFYDGHNSGIDWTMEQKIEHFQNIEKKTIELGDTGDMVDIKSAVNINSYQKLKGIFKPSNTDNWPPEIRKLLDII